MPDAARAAGAGPTSLGGLPLVVPVVSAAGGVGRSVLSALLAAALSDATTDPAGRAVAVCDVSPRAASPWPGWVDHAAPNGTGWLASHTGDPERFATELRRSTSALNRGDAQPVWVLTDTGPVNPAFSGAYHAPLLWSPLLRYVRAAVIDADPFEGSRLARQRHGGPPATMAAWMRAAAAQTAVLWVTDPSPAGLARTLEAVTAAEDCGLPTRQVVVAVNDVRGHGWMPRSRSRRTLLEGRVGSIVEIGHHSALRDGGRPACTARDTASRDLARLASAVLAAARPSVIAALSGTPAQPAAAASPYPARPERTHSHVPLAHPLPALS